MNIPTFIAIDLETTGLEFDKDEIIEVALMRFQDGSPAESLDYLVRPASVKLRPFIESLTGISQKDLDESEDFASLAGKIRSFIGDSPIVAHNANFDASFLRAAYAKNPQLVPGNPVIDSLVVSRTILPELENHKLGYMAGLFKRRNEIAMRIDSEKMHRAVYDCEMLMEVFVAILRRRFKEKDWELGNIMASMAKYKGTPQFINK